MTDPNLLGKGTNTYTNIFTFLGCPLTRELDDQVYAVVMGVPYDLATSGHRAHVMDPPVFARHLQCYGGRKNAGPIRLHWLISCDYHPDKAYLKWLLG